MRATCLGIETAAGALWMGRETAAVSVLGIVKAGRLLHLRRRGARGYPEAHTRAEPAAVQRYAGSRRTAHSALGSGATPRSVAEYPGRHAGRPPV